MPPPDVRPARRRVDGVLLLDKPVGRSSHAALQHAKHLFAARKAGHTGTLDPLASGLLPICFGEATKFSQVVLDAPKEYVATVRFGVATTTGDAEGDVVAVGPVDFGRPELERIAARFRGPIEQVPPRHAALKYEGRKYYEYARAGVEIPRAARSVEIEAIEILDWSSPLAVLRIACSKGTYVRVLAEDLGTALGSAAHLAALRRTRTGPFALENATTLDALEALSTTSRDALLLPVHAPLADRPGVVVDAVGAAALRAGRAVASTSAAVRGRVPCFEESGGFIGLVESDDVGMRPVRLLGATE